MIQELHAGDRQIPASGWNEMRAAVQGITPAQQQYQSAARNPVYITVKNVTGSDLPAFSVVKLSGATYTRTGDTFINQAIASGVELNGDTPATTTDTIAITQAACAAGEFVKAIVSGATACKVYKASNVNYQYASVTAGQSGYLTGSDDVTGVRVLWIATGTGNKEAYVLLDNVGAPEQEYFLINPGNDGTGTQVNDPSVYTIGSLHYVTYSTVYKAWIPYSQNEGTPATAPNPRPDGVKLAVCQRDAPDSAAEYKMPYYTPESNIGVPPLISTYNEGYIGKRCGVLMGEHEFTNGGFDYLVTGLNGSNGTVASGSGTFAYNPRFIEQVEADGNTGGGNTPNCNIFGQTWDILLPTASTGLSRCSYPDIYPGDEVLVLVDVEAQQCWGVDYPCDFPENDTVIGFYAPGGRGWTSTTTPQAIADIGLEIFIKNKTGAIT